MATGKEYVYKLVKEDYTTGERGKRTKTIHRYKPLRVGGLYGGLGCGFPGFYRVLELISETEFDD